MPDAAPAPAFRCSCCAAPSLPLPPPAARWSAERPDRWFAEQGWTCAPVPKCKACSAKPAPAPWLDRAAAKHAAARNLTPPRRALALADLDPGERRFYAPMGAA